MVLNVDTTFLVEAEVSGHARQASTRSHGAAADAFPSLGRLKLSIVQGLEEMDVAAVAILPSAPPGQGCVEDDFFSGGGVEARGAVAKTHDERPAVG